MHEDIVGDDVEHNPNQRQRNSRRMKKALICMSEQENLEEQANQDNEKPTQNRKKKHEHKSEQSWSRKEHSSRREEGVAYLDRRNISMPARLMGPPCNC